jgi:glutamate synthase domain-containing protein 2
MSYGALSDNAILALSTAAKQGNFYHNTGGEPYLAEFD